MFLVLDTVDERDRLLGQAGRTFVAKPIFSAEASSLCPTPIKVSLDLLNLQTAQVLEDDPEPCHGIPQLRSCRWLAAAPRATLKQSETACSSPPAGTLRPARVRMKSSETTAL